MGLAVEIISLEHTITDITLQLQCTEMEFLYKGYEIIWDIQVRI